MIATGRGLAGAALAAPVCAHAAGPRPAAHAATWPWQRASSSAGPPASPAECLPARVQVVPYGILGSSDKGAVAEEPDASTVFVDPAGLKYVRGDLAPSGAGGAAGVIYRWLGLASMPSFPEPVRAAITAPTQAKFHAYGKAGEKKCIHVVGPDFRQKDYTRAEAVAELSEAYGNVLREFCTTGLRRLRLLPVSGGIFSGPFASELPQLTAEALQAGFARLRAEEQRQVLEADIEMCIFMNAQVEGFREAFRAMASP